MSSSWQSRVKTKSFTGCWTCRERKVKCDEGRPSCQQCIERDFECQGYALRLQWLAPLTVSGYNACGSKAPTSCGTVRRRVLFCGRSSIFLSTDHLLSSWVLTTYEERPRRILASRQIDSLLDRIEADAPTSGLLTVLHGPFATFSASPKSSTSTSTPCVADAIAEQCSGILTDYSSTSPGPACDRTKSEYGSWGRRSSETHLPPTPQSLYTLLSSPGNSTDVSASRIPAEVEYLLHHFTTDVVDFMTAVPTPKGPWKTVHLPRAIQGCGEVAFRGTTSHARNALLHALLAIGAYNLGAKCTTSGQTSHASSWRQVALEHTNRSIAYLKSCLQSHCAISERGKYKEVLAAMLAMITVEVCSGDTSSSEWHLQGIEDFINATQRKPGRRYSRKVQALHREYVYLRIMRETMNLRCISLDIASLDSSSEDITAWLCRPLCFLDGLNAPATWLQESGPASSIDYSACEFIYGIPLPLLVLASKTAELIRRKRSFARHHPGLIAPELFLAMCDDLEIQVLKWPVDRMLGDIDKLPIAESSKSLIEHQTRAFHQAVIIYFSRLVRGVHRRHLQPYAESIIDHLESAERIKDESNHKASCISWPWFIGAAEVLDEELRARYLQWSHSLRFYDLGAYEKAIEVIMEVWEHDTGLTPVCDWPKVVEAKEIKLMLM